MHRAGVANFVIFKTDVPDSIEAMFPDILEAGVSEIPCTKHIIAHAIAAWKYIACACDVSNGPPAFFLSRSMFQPLAEFNCIDAEETV